MKKLKQFWWWVPATIRKPFVLIVGSLFIIAAGLTGWLPGPGGVPLFLIGIAILATEFAWAKRVRDFVLAIVERCVQAYRRRRVLGTIILILLAGGVIFIGLSLWKLFN